MMDNSDYPSNVRKPMPDSVFPVAQPRGEASLWRMDHQPGPLIVDGSRRVGSTRPSRSRSSRISWAAGWCEIDLAVRRHADQLTAAK